MLRELLGDDARRLGVLRRVDDGAVRGEDYLVTISHYGAAAGGWRTVDEQSGNLYINKNVYFENVPVRVWSYERGSYPVLKKWLGYRDMGRRLGQPLSIEEVDHFRGMVHRIEALHRLHPQLDALYAEACAHPFIID